MVLSHILSILESRTHFIAKFTLMVLNRSSKSSVQGAVLSYGYENSIRHR